MCWWRMSPDRSEEMAALTLPAEQSEGAWGEWIRIFTSDSFHTYSAGHPMSGHFLVEYLELGQHQSFWRV